MFGVIVNFSATREKYKMKRVRVLFGRISDILLNAEPLVKSRGLVKLIHQDYLSSISDHAMSSIQMYDCVALVWILFEQGLDLA